MIHTLSNEFLSVSLNQVGAELCSIKNTSTNTEYIWNADPKFWVGHAPVLFPIVGSLKDNTYFFKGEKYSLPRHGFVRNNKNIKLLSRKENEISFSLCSNKESLKSYPFPFELIISFALKDRTITIRHDVINTGDSEMFFSIGAHPAFKCPLKAVEKYEDYHLEFEQNENLHNWKIEEGGLIGEKAEKILDNSNTIQLHNNIFEKGAIILKQPKSNSIYLVNNQNAPRVKVDFTGFDIIGLWAIPNAPFVCIEPWLGIADSFDTNQQLEDKEGILKLSAKQSFKATYSIEIFSDN